MGYFSNATENDIWMAENCAKCEHWNGRALEDLDRPGCMVEFIHLNWNYGQEEGSDLKKVMDCLIPRNEEKCFNEQCRMFIEKKNGLDGTIREMNRLKKENKQLKEKMLKIGWNNP